MEKYGFVYVWYDKKHKRYYVGRHWGTEDDGYISSSSNMTNNYRNRPQDFKRRIVSVVYSKELLVEEEQRWLDMIKKEELSSRYYNKTLKAHMPSMNGRKHSEETKQRMSKSALGRPKSEEHKEKLRQANLGKTYSEEVNSKKGRKFSEERKKQISEKMKEHYKLNPRSEETRKKISENNKRLQKLGIIGNAKNFKIMSPNKRVFEGKNLKEFCKEQQINYGSIINRRKTKGWILITDK